MKKNRIKELETELRLIYNQLYVIDKVGSGIHARHSKFLKRYWDIVSELERISLKWKIKKFIRRIKNYGKN